MRHLATILAAYVVAGCAASRRPDPSPRSPPVPVSFSLVTRTCADAAIGIERVTKDLRPPERDVRGPVQRRCADDQWSAKAIECFASMTGDELTVCARQLPEEGRVQLIADVIGNNSSDGDVTEIVAKLSVLKVGILNCDRFVSAVANVMTCTSMSLEVRVSLGNETADFWSLPTNSLPLDAKAQIAAACGESLQALQQQAIDVGCMP